MYKLIYFFLLEKTYGIVHPKRHLQKYAGSHKISCNLDSELMT